jgi:hypothetical protein
MSPNIPSDNRALTSLNLSNNTLGCGLFKGNVHGWDVSQGHTQAEDNPANYAADTTGIVALADAIPGMGALVKLDISRNSIPSEQEWHLKRICAAGGIELAI